MPKRNSTLPLFDHVLPAGFGALLAAVLLALLGGPVLALPGDLDPTFAGFGVGGMVHRVGYPMGGGERGMVVQPDGKIVAAGYTGDGLLVMRFLPDGTPDPSFGGGDGVFTATYPNVVVRGTSVAVQADGKIVVGGWADSQPANFMVARIMPAGNAMDGSFGVAGFVFTDFSGDTDEAYSLLIQPDGKIIASGRALIGNDYDLAVARYNTDGSLDHSFDGDGLVTVGFGDIGPNNNEACYAMALQPNGRLVLAGGITRYGGSAKFKVARLTTSGALDASFASDGKSEISFIADDVHPTAVAVGPDGRIVVAGTDGFSSNPAYWWTGYTYLVAYLPNGNLDPSFDGDGKLVIENLRGEVRDIAVQPDGKIVTFGWVDASLVQANPLFRRLNPDGSPDASFGASGTANFLVGGYAVGYALALLPDGRMLGFASNGTEHILVRIWPDGTLDAGGKQAIGFTTPGFGPATDEVGAAMAVQPDGKLLMAGTVYDVGHTTSDFAVTRFLADGQVDASFGVSGRATFAFDQPDVATSMALQPDGKIVVAGYTTSGTNPDFMVVRFNANGSVDGSFGILGVRVIDFAGGADYGNAVAVTPDGKIVVVGAVTNGARFVFGVARLNGNGSPDASFDTDGKQMAEFSGISSHWATSVAILPDNRILMGGAAGGDFALMRLNVDGSYDLTFGSQFGGSGKVRYDMGGFDFMSALKLDRNGVIYAAGTRDIGGHTVFALLRVLSYGQAPTCFPTPCDLWTNGKFTVDWGVNAAAYSIDVRSDNQVLVGGIASGRMAWAQVGIGKTPTVIEGTAEFPGSQETASSIRFIGPSQLVAAGYYDDNGHQAFALARFNTTFNVLAVEGSPGPAPAACVLRAASPNPLRERTTIGFDLPRAGSARLAMYDVAGRLVRTLAQGALEAGHHEGVWDGTDESGRAVAAGVYFARLDADGSSARRTVVVMK